jgi:DNA-binding PadR family transcriptional regulator
LVKQARGNLGRGTVYVTLARMEDKRLVESRTEDPLPGWSGHPRRRYRATGYGRRTYEAWQMAVAHLAEAF